MCYRNVETDMKADKKLATSAGVAGVIYVEESLIWLIDRVFDVLLAYKDTLMQLVI